MFKRIVAAVLSVMLLAVMVGCSSGNTPASSSTAAQSSSTGESSEASAAPAESAAPEAPAVEVKWPKNVEIVVPASAGGDSDYNARLLANLLSQKIGVNFVVSNVSGNGGATGTRQVKDGPTDGSSVLFYHSAFVVNQLSGTTDYGFDSYEFACIPAVSPGNALTVNASLGVKTLDELFAYAKANPGKLKMAAQTGATSYAVSMLLKQAGLDVNIVDAGSAADRLAALLGGHVDVILAGYGAIKDYVTEGELVPLAMDGNSDLIADGVEIKSILNQGYEITLPFYYFFAFPKGTDPNLVQQFNAAVQDIVENNEEYAASVSSTYYQTPTFYNTEDALAKFADVYDILQDVDFKG